MTYLFIFITHLFIILLVSNNCVSFLNLFYFMYTHGLFVRNKPTTK